MQKSHYYQVRTTSPGLQCTDWTKEERQKEMMGWGGRSEGEGCPSTMCQAGLGT